MATTPPINQTNSTCLPLLRSDATSEGEIKIPDPILAPVAIIVSAKKLIDLESG